MIVPVMAISNLVLTQQIYSEETNGAHAHYREPVPLILYTSIQDGFERLARFKVAFTTLSSAVLAIEKCFAEVVT